MLTDRIYKKQSYNFMNESVNYYAKVINHHSLIWLLAGCEAEVALPAFVNSYTQTYVKSGPKFAQWEM